MSLVIAEAVTDLPDPDSPTKAKVSPTSIERSKFCTTLESPWSVTNETERFLISSNLAVDNRGGLPGTGAAMGTAMRRRRQPPPPSHRCPTMRHGSEAVWPYYYAGTMGMVQRDGINRLRHVMGYSRQAKTICTSICEAGWVDGVGRL